MSAALGCATLASLCFAFFSAMKNTLQGSPTTGVWVLSALTLAVLALAAAPVRAQEAPAAPAASAPSTLPALGTPASAASAPSASPAPGQPSQAGQPGQVVEVRARRPDVQGSQRSISGRDAALVPGAGSDAIKALQSLPGVVTANDASGEPAVRGSRPTDNAYEVDFLPVGYLFHGGGLVSVLPGELVQRFDLYSAAFGPQFADVTGAVLDVRLRDPKTDAFHATLDASFIAAGFVAEGPLAPGHSVLVAARRSYLDWLVDEVKDDNSGVITQLPRYRDYQLKYLWEPNERHRLSLHLSGAADHISYEVPAGSVLAQQEPVFTGSGHNDTAYDSAALQWEQDLGAGSDQRLALGSLNTRVNSRTGTAVDLGASVQTTYLREQAHLRLQPEHELWLGGSLNHSQVKLGLDLRNPRCTEFETDCDYSSADAQRVDQRLNMDQQDLHARERWQFQPDWALTTGLRYSRDAYLEESVLEPRLGLEWAATASTSFSAAWGLHHQQPAVEQILPELGNPELRSLRARHSMLGMSQKLAGNWNWRAELYYKQLDRLVIADEQLNYRNAGSGQAWGAELLLRKEPGGAPGLMGQVSGWMSVSWARSLRQNDATGERFAFEFDQPLVLNLVARWQRDERVSFGAKWSVHSGSLYTPITGSYVETDGRVRPRYGALNSQRLPVYHRLDLRMDYRLSPRLTGYVELINAYNHANISGYSYNADYSQRNTETQLPFLPSVGVKLDF